MTRREWAFLCVAALVVLALRAPFLAPTLEDIDSVNFDLGVHDYDPAAHRPHPPGYPVYIVLAKIAHSVFDSHATALASLSALFSALSVFPLYVLMRELASGQTAAVACLFTLFNPLLWFNSVRPMSDLVGFFASTTVQCLLVTSLVRGRIGWYAGSALAGVAAGVRIQILLLTLPLLLYGCLRDRSRWRFTLVAFGAGVSLWLVPLVYVMGGLRAVLDNFSPVFEDTLTRESVVSQWSLRRAVFAAHDLFVAPWQSPALAIAMLVLAVVGALMLARRNPRSLALALLIFVPYTVYHYAVQDAQTIRYALPSIPLIALLASTSVVRIAGRSSVLTAAVSIGSVAAAAVTTVPALVAYHATPSPAVQAVTRIAESAASEPAVASGHYVFDRYLPLLPPQIERLSAVPGQEWRMLVDFWKQGRQEPVLFMQEPRRITLLLFGRDAQQTLGQWRWPPSVQPFLKGARPASVELVRLLPPRWITEQGFLASFVGRRTGEYPRRHRLAVRPARQPRVFMASGSLDAASGPATLSLRRGEETIGTWVAEDDFSIHTVLPPLLSDTYVPLLLQSSQPVEITDVWLERDTRAVIRPGEGFYFLEHDEQASRFRWIAPKAHASVYLPGKTARLTIAGRIPLDYYRLPVTVSLVWNDKPLTSFIVSGEQFRFDFELERVSESPWGTLTILSSHSFVPDARTGNGDHRVLGLRIYQLELTTPDAPM